MFIEVLKSKIHKVTVTEANLNYVGSVSIDEDLMDASNIIENEKVQVLNICNGERLETYVIKGKRGSGQICLNGPAAQKGGRWRCCFNNVLCHDGFSGCKIIQTNNYFP